MLNEEKLSESVVLLQVRIEAKTFFSTPNPIHLMWNFGSDQSTIWKLLRDWCIITKLKIFSETVVPSTVICEKMPKTNMPSDNNVSFELHPKEEFNTYELAWTFDLQLWVSPKIILKNKWTIAARCRNLQNFCRAINRYKSLAEPWEHIWRQVFCGFDLLIQKDTPRMLLWKLTRIS